MNILYVYNVYLLLISFVHMFFNIVIQLILGIPLEMVHKWWRVGIVYLSGVVAGSLGASISDPFSYLAGASGGVYALISAHLASVVIVSFHLFMNLIYSLQSFIYLFNLHRIGKKWNSIGFD